MSWLVVIVIAGHTFISYEPHSTRELCEIELAAVVDHTYVARCMTIEDALGLPTGLGR